MKPKPAPEPRHDPRTMSYKHGQLTEFKSDRGEFAFRENSEPKSVNGDVKPVGKNFGR